MDKIKLPLASPDVRGYLHHAFPNAIMANHNYYTPWFFSNYIQLYCAKNFDDMFCPLNFYLYQDYNNYSLLECYRIHRELVLSTSNIFDFTINSIQQGYHVLMFINDFFIPGRGFYHLKCFTHDLLISGYDQQNKTFHASTFINKIYSEFSISFDELENAFTYCDYNEDDWAGVIHLLRNDQRINYPFNICQTIEFLENYLDAKNTFRSSFFPIQDHLAFGVDVYKYLIHDLVRLVDGVKPRFDIRPVHILWEHKKCMLSRIKYLEENRYINNTNYYDEYIDVEKVSNNIRLKLLKYNINKKKSTIDNIINDLNYIATREQTVLAPLLKDLKETYINSLSNEI